MIYDDLKAAEALRDAGMADQGDLLDLIDADPIHLDDSTRIKRAIVTDGKTHLGQINPNRVRKALTNSGGNLDVFHKSVGPAYFALKRAGLIEETSPIRSDDTAGRNAGKWIATYRLTDAGWYDSAYPEAS